MSGHEWRQKWYQLILTVTFEVLCRCSQCLCIWVRFQRAHLETSMLNLLKSKLQKYSLQQHWMIYKIVHVLQLTASVPPAEVSLAQRCWIPPLQGCCLWLCVLLILSRKEVYQILTLCDSLNLKLILTDRLFPLQTHNEARKKVRHSNT